MKTFLSVRLCATIILSAFFLTLFPGPVPVVAGSSPASNAYMPVQQSGQTYTDPLYGYKLLVSPGWYVMPTPANALVGVATFFNYDAENWNDPQAMPPGGAKIQIGVGPLQKALLSEWTDKRITAESRPNPIQPSGLSTSQTASILLGNNTGLVTVLNDGSDYIVTEIEFQRHEEVISIGITTADAGARQDALALIATLIPDKNAAPNFPRAPQIAGSVSLVEGLVTQAHVPSIPSGTCPVGTFPGI